MRRLPPSATLFPYTTLFRSVSAAHVSYQQASVNDGRRGRAINRRSRFELPGEIFPPEQLAFRRVVTGQNAGDAKRRSEEHTSELQSLRHLVCRLLLEKKKST